MTTTALVLETLGGVRALRSQPATAVALRESVRRGLPYASLEAAAKRLGLGRAEVMKVVGVPARTLARRKASRRLSPGESDRLYRLSRVAALAEEALGSTDKAKHWLHAPNRALGHEVPVALLDTDVGTRQVEDVLGRIAHGVYS